MTYLDWAATALPDKEIYSESQEIALEFPGNPSSQHKLGKAAKEQLESYRQRAAEALGCESSELYLTSGGTESNNLVVTSLLHQASPGEIIFSSLEHPSVMEPVKSLKKWDIRPRELKPDRDGRITAKKLQKLLTEDTRMVCILGVHNTTGAIQPIEKLAKMLRNFQGDKRPIHFHCDLVQAPGKIPFKLRDLDVDSASFSGHKFGAPRGTGLLYLKRPFPPLYRGGGQERGFRSGTESLQNMVALTLGLEKAIHQEISNLQELSNYSIEKLRESFPKMVFNPPARETHPESFVPHILNFSIPPIPGEVLHRVLDQADIALSHGSACAANGRKKPEDLHAMEIPPKVAHCSVRLSMGPTTTKADLDAFLNAIKKQTHDLGLLS